MCHLFKYKVADMLYRNNPIGANCRDNCNSAELETTFPMDPGKYKVLSSKYRLDMIDSLLQLQPLKQTAATMKNEEENIFMKGHSGQKCN